MELETDLLIIGGGTATRWPGYQDRIEHPKLDDENWLVHINSRRDPSSGEIEVFTRKYEQLVPGDMYKA